MAGREGDGFEAIRPCQNAGRLLSATDATGLVRKCPKPGGEVPIAMFHPGNNLTERLGS